MLSVRRVIQSLLEARPRKTSVRQVEIVPINFDPNDDLFKDFTQLLAEYFNQHKNPMTRFDVAHLMRFLWHQRFFGKAFVAYGDGKPIGCVVLECMEARVTRPHENELSRLFVLPEYRSNGVGLMLMRRCAEELQKFSVDYLFLCVGENEPAYEYYRSLGFTVNKKAQEAGTKGVAYLEIPVTQFLENSK